jgi:hypothetical protein
MKIEYRMTENDYVKAMQLHAWRQFTRMRVIAPRAIIMILVLGAWWWALQGRAVPDAAQFFALCLMLVLMLAVRPALRVYIVAPYSARRMYRQYKAIKEPVTIALSDDGLLFNSVEGEMILLWRMVLHWRQNDQFVLIYKMPLLFYPVPKSLAQQGFDIPLLVQRLTERVGPEC